MAILWRNNQVAHVILYVELSKNGPRWNLATAKVEQ